MPSTGKKERGQFYTVECSYILDGIPLNMGAATRIVEPFAGKGDLLTWLAKKGLSLPLEAYDIEPKADSIQKRDTLMNPCNYEGAWILTNPPYLARNKSDQKALFDKYDTNDLYKCFLLSLVQTPCCGGIIIIPAGFFLSPRDIDVRCRAAFLSTYRILYVRYFEETVFPDTTTTVVAISFVSSAEVLKEQSVQWQIFPSKEERIFKMSAEDDWIIGGHIYRVAVAEGVLIRRHVVGQKKRDGEQTTSMTLNALDSGTMGGRICLEYREGFVYPAKESSRTYATLCILGRTLSAEQQKMLCSEFNKFVEEKRSSTWSLFLPQFRESKEYARKRIPFELGYRILGHMIKVHLP